MNTSLYMLFRAIRSHSTVALSGESADEAFGGYAWFHAPQAVQAPTFPWLAFLMQARTPAELLDRDLLAKLDMTAFIADSYHSALAEVPYLPGRRGLERRMREIGYLHLTRFLPALLDRKDRTSMAVGLEVRVPFCDHRLVEYVFNTPWAIEDLRRPGEKPASRRRGRHRSRLHPEAGQEPLSATRASLEMARGFWQA